MNTTATNPYQQAVQPVTWNFLLTQSYGLYRKRFWRLFCVALLPALLAYLWRYVYHLAVRHLLKTGALVFPSKSYLAIVAALGWLDGAFYWIVSVFFFAAVATVVLGLSRKQQPAISDAFTQARARIGALTGVALLCWTIFWLGRAATTFALWSALDRLRLHPSFYAMALILSLPSLLLAGLLARLALTVPALMDQPEISIKEAMRASLKKTEGWELFFMMFLVKSAVLAFGLYWLVDYGLDWLWQRAVLTQSIYPWFSQAFYICIAAAVESPLFIAFSMLYRDSRVTEVEALSAAAIE
jgi:hypothetical protein